MTLKTNDYQKRKAAAQQEAIEWQANFASQNYSWEDIANWGEHFTRLGRRYGLLREFRENGII